MDKEAGNLAEEESFNYDRYEAESWSSSDKGPFVDLICPILRSYSSLDLISSCSDVDEDECRMIKLNNAVKKLSDLLNDCSQREEVDTAQCLIRQILRYNGTLGFYLRHLPQIDEILEQLSVRAREVVAYLVPLEQLLLLCGHPPRLGRASEALTSETTLRRHFGLLGYLLALAPTARHFLLTKRALERLVGPDIARSHDLVGSGALHQALGSSRLPLTLAELAHAASNETYSSILELLLAVVTVSRDACYRLLEAGIENELLLRMTRLDYESSHENPDSNSSSSYDGDTDLHSVKEAHHYDVSTELATEVLWRLMTSVVLAIELPESLKQLCAPTKSAMENLKAAFQQAVLQAGSSSCCRKLRNNLASLMLAGLVRSRTRIRDTWDLIECGLADDLVLMCIATELGAPNTWFQCTSFDIHGLDALDFKKTLLLIVAQLARSSCNNELFKNKGLACGLLQLIDPKYLPGKPSWNSEQLCRLYKYAVNALAYIAPKIPEEFIEHKGSPRLLATLEQYIKSDYDDAHVTCLVEMICSLSSANCDALLDDFSKYDFITLLLQFINQIIRLKALSIACQKIAAFLLVISENIVEYEKNIRESHRELIVETGIDLLKRCLRQTNEDSELEQSFLVASGSFIWKCIADHYNATNDFLMKGGLYLILDLIENMKLPIKNFYLSVLCDMCDAESSGCFLFSWRRTDKSKGLLSLLTNIWKEEERMFGVKRTVEGCIGCTQFPIMNDEEWHYVHFINSSRDCQNIITITIGSVRPKVYFLHEFIKSYAEQYQVNYYEALRRELSTEEQITLETINDYPELQKDETMLTISRVLNCCGVRPLTKASEPIRGTECKLTGRSAQVLERQAELLEQRRAKEEHFERIELDRMRDTNLAPTLDALERLAFIGRTSNRVYRLKKVDEQRSQVEFVQDEMRLDKTPFYRTFDFQANVTNVFNQQVKIQSILKNLGEDSLRYDPSTYSAYTLTSPSTCSLLSYKSDDSFLHKRYKFDASGNNLIKN